MIANGYRSSGISQQRLDRLRRVLEGYVEREEVAGVVAMIHRHGEEAGIEMVGWQDKEMGLPMKRDTIFRIASMTKPIISVAILTLVEEGKIRLYDPVDTWLPELANRMVMRDPNGSVDDVYPAPRAITLHDLLTYRQGIGWGQSSLRGILMGMNASPAAGALQFPGIERLGPDEWMARLGTLPLIHEPGTYWHYQIASDILGVLIARIAGQPLETFLRERIFEPLGMVDTSFWVPQEKRDRFATLYAQTAEGKLTVRDHSQTTGWAEPPLFPAGSSGLVSTVDDFQRFGLMLLNKGKIDSVRILSRKTVEAMTTDYLTAEQHTHVSTQLDRFDMDRAAGMWENAGFGYGVGVRTKRLGLGPSVGSFYWPGAFGTTWIADPEEGLMATCLSQVVNTNPFYTQLNEDFLSMMYQAIED